MGAGDVVVDITTPVGRKGAHFDGVDDELTTGTHFDFDDLSHSFIVSLWFYKEVTGAVGDIIDCRDANDDGWRIAFNGTDNIIASINGIDATTGLTYENGWHHLVVYFCRTSTIKIYVDGSLVTTSASIAAAVMDTTANFYIGRNAQAPGEVMKGFISDVKIFEGSKTSMDLIVSNVLADINVNDHLVAHWPLNNDYNDVSGNGHHLINSECYLAIKETAVSSIIASRRVTANDKFLISSSADGKQVITTAIEEAP